MTIILPRLENCFNLPDFAIVVRMNYSMNMVIEYGSP